MLNWSKTNVNISQPCPSEVGTMSSFPVDGFVHHTLAPWWAYTIEYVQLNIQSWEADTIEYMHKKSLICNAKEKYAHTIICLTILQNNMRKKWCAKLCTKIICRKNISLALHQKMIGSSLQRTLIACCCCILASYSWNKWELWISCK